MEYIQTHMMVFSSESKLRYEPYTLARGQNVSYYGSVAHYALQVVHLPSVYVGKSPVRSKLEAVLPASDEVQSLELALALVELCVVPHSLHSRLLLDHLQQVAGVVVVLVLQPPSPPSLTSSLPSARDQGVLGVHVQGMLGQGPLALHGLLHPLVHLSCAERLMHSGSLVVVPVAPWHLDLGFFISKLPLVGPVRPLLT